MHFTGHNGKNIHARVWNAVEHPKAVVQIVHGMAEHGKRYKPFGDFLNANGYIVASDDHRGHGRTDAETLGYCDGDMFADTVEDEAIFTDYLRAQYGLPVILFGFSYGSFLVQSYLSKYSDKLAAAVIAGSSYKKDMEVRFGNLVAGMGCLFGAERPAKLIEKLSFGAYAAKFDDEQWLSVDADNNAAYAADPRCGFTCSFRFYRDFFKGLLGLYTPKYIAGLKKDLPILIASGEDDPVGAMGKGVKKLYKFYTEKAGMQDVHMVIFENSRHEFLNEAAGRDKKWGDMLAFFDSVVPSREVPEEEAEPIGQGSEPVAQEPAGETNGDIPGQTEEPLAQSGEESVDTPSGI